jgi:uncharacterized protein (TIGR03083 family)
VDAVREEIASARRELADYLETLDDDAWNAQSLCDKWKVRDVVGHVTLPLTTPVRKIALKMATSGFNFDKANDRLSRERGSTLSREQLIQDLRDNAEHPFKPPGMGHEAPLTDITVHTSDIRRPLGAQPQLPERRAELVLDFLAKAPKGFVAKKRVAGLRFEASDIDWSHGDGPVVRGPAEALIMVLNGRAAALDDLEGDGVAILRSRF